MFFFYPTKGRYIRPHSAEASPPEPPWVAYNVDALPEIVSHKEVGLCRGI